MSLIVQWNYPEVFLTIPVRQGERVRYKEKDRKIEKWRLGKEREKKEWSKGNKERKKERKKERTKQTEKEGRKEKIKER